MDRHLQVSSNAEAVFQAVRSNYLEQLEAFVTERRANGENVEVELKIELNQPSELLTGRYCLDLCSAGDAEGLADFWPDREITFERFVFNLASLEVTVGALRWDDVVITTDLEVADRELLCWFEKWFDAQDERRDEQSLFSMVVHSALVEANSVSIDFGSAPTEALWELLVMLMDCGVRAVELHRSQE